ncbi:hypothetical protein ACFWP3_10140 [Streptomyces sp. NPDC058525]|uniref:hypothetical protein n=1 Tax=unclassified Streptomyces TaxID=2593676 RepID=UPI00366159DC
MPDLKCDSPPRPAYPPGRERSARAVLGLDTPDTPGVGIAAVRQPSAELLDRALVGFERFITSGEAQTDE